MAHSLLAAHSAQDSLLSTQTPPLATIPAFFSQLSLLQSEWQEWCALCSACDHECDASDSFFILRVPRQAVRGKQTIPTMTWQELDKMVGKEKGIQSSEMDESTCESDHPILPGSLGSRLGCFGSLGSQGRLQIVTSFPFHLQQLRSVNAIANCDRSGLTSAKGRKR